MHVFIRSGGIEGGIEGGAGGRGRAEGALAHQPRRPAGQGGGKGGELSARGQQGGWLRGGANT